jgi:hypothetical protein
MLGCVAEALALGPIYAYALTSNSDERKLVVEMLRLLLEPLLLLVQVEFQKVGVRYFLDLDHVLKFMGGATLLCFITNSREALTHVELV